MAIGKSVRIYDLAREVKQDTKRVMEDLRREGADVSVASNSVSEAIADKVRNKYFPKTEVAPKRAIKIIKAGAKPAEAPADGETESTSPVEEAPTHAAEPAAPVTPPVKRVQAKPAPVEAEAPAEPTPSKVKVLTKRAV